MTNRKFQLFEISRHKKIAICNLKFEIPARSGLDKAKNDEYERHCRERF